MHLILSRGAYRCLKAIKSYDFRRRGWSCPGQDTIAKDLGVSIATVKRYVSELRAKSYLQVNRRPNSSSVYRFGLRSAQNEPTVGSKSEPAGEPAREPTIQLILKSTNTTAQRKPPRKETTIMEMPEYYRTPKEQKLWRMAARWISENNPNLGPYSADRCAPIMELLDKAGAAELLEDAHLPVITWPPPDLPKRPFFDTDVAKRKPPSAAFMHELRRMKEGGE